jgi:hypothetical protein
MYNYNSPYLYPYQQNGQIQGVKFVHGRAEAERCTLPLNSKAILMDIDRDFFYLKETDMSGISSITEYSFQKVEGESSKEIKDNFMTKEEFKEWEERYESIISKLVSAADKSNESTVGLRKDDKPTTSTKQD